MVVGLRSKFNMPNQMSAITATVDVVSTQRSGFLCPYSGGLLVIVVEAHNSRNKKRSKKKTTTKKR